MGLFGKKVKHQPLRGLAEINAAYGDERSDGSSWNIWMPKFALAGQRDDCFAAQLVLVNGAAHCIMDGIDYGPVSEYCEALEAIADYGGTSCPAVLRITKPNADNYSISVRRRTHPVASDGAN